MLMSRPRVSRVSNNEKKRKNAVNDNIYVHICIKYMYMYIIILDKHNVVELIN